MRTFDKIRIHGSFPYIPPILGARRVVGRIDGVWVPAGWLMPTLKDSRQQPKSLAFRLLEDRLDTKN